MDLFKETMSMDALKAKSASDLQRDEDAFLDMEAQDEVKRIVARLRSKPFMQRVALKLAEFSMGNSG